MFTGSSYTDSLFLTFTKGIRTRDQLLGTINVIKEQYFEEANNAKESEDQEEFEELYKIYAVLTIFTKNKNVIPFSPCDEKSRNLIMDLVFKATPIHISSLSIAIDQRNEEILKQNMIVNCRKDKMNALNASISSNQSRIYQVEKEI